MGEGEGRGWGEGEDEEGGNEKWERVEGGIAGVKGWNETLVSGKSWEGEINGQRRRMRERGGKRLCLGVGIIRWRVKGRKKAPVSSEFSVQSPFRVNRRRRGGREG